MMTRDVLLQILDLVNDGIYYVDNERKVTYWNKMAEVITGYSANEMIGRYCHEMLMHVDSEGETICQGICPIIMAMVDGKVRETLAYLKHKAGHRVPVHVRTIPLWAEDGRILGVVEVFTDLSTHMEMEQRIRSLEKVALLDEVTGIGNRRYMEIKIKHRLEEVSVFGWPVGIMFIDIDGFKKFNDQNGHSVGDMVLRLVAKTIFNALRPFDLVGRWGGDEFVVLIENCDELELGRYAEKIRVLVENSGVFGKDGTMIHPTVSIGACMVRPNDTLETLVARVDRLMYMAKQGGRNRVVSQLESSET